jgi:arginase
MILYFRGDILPGLLRSHLERTGNTVHIYDSEEIKYEDSKPSEDEEAIFKANLSLRQLVIESIMTNTKTLNIGGDHTMGMGTVSAFLECFEKSEKVVIWIDAHADANTRKSSKSGHYHGMPVAFLLGLDNDAKFPVKVPLKAEELIYVGLRDVDPFEKDQVKRRFLLIYS